MLVLTRKDGEKIRIGDDIVVTVIRTSSGLTKLAFEAPQDIRILRDELLHDNGEALRSLVRHG